MKPDVRSRQLRMALLWILACGVAAILAITGYAGGIKAWVHWTTILSVLPLVMLYPLRYTIRGTRSGITAVAGASAITVPAFAAYVYAVFLKPDAQSSLVFLTAPCCQAIAVLFLYLMIYLLRDGEKPRQEMPSNA